jgi:hypothetical protein
MIAASDGGVRELRSFFSGLPQARHEEVYGDVVVVCAHTCGMDCALITNKHIKDDMRLANFRLLFVPLCTDSQSISKAGTVYDFLLIPRYACSFRRLDSIILLPSRLSKLV